MKNKFVTYDIALKLKELGFDEECLYYFDSSAFTGSSSASWQNWNKSESLISKPLWQDVIDWFEEQHKLVIIVEPYTAKYRTYKIYRLTEVVEIICLYGRDVNLDGDKPKRYDDSYTARKEAILKAIEIISWAKFST